MKMRSIRAAAKELKEVDPKSALGLTTLYRLAANGAIPTVRIGRTILVDLDHLDDYLTGAHSESVAVPGGVRPVEVRQ